MSKNTLSLNDRLADVAARYPDRPAIVWGTKTVTFGELMIRIASVADELERQAIGSGERVGVLLPNTPDFVIAVFAIWGRGAIVAPFHMLYRQAEIVRYASDCEIVALMASDKMRETVAVVADDVSSLKHIWSCPSAGGVWQHRVLRHVQPSPASERASRRLRGGPALTQYSTGSMGVPKRVTASHEHILAEVDAVASALGVTSADRILGIAPFFHAYGLRAVMLVALLSGATLYAVNDFFPKDIARLIDQEEITGLPIVPLMCQQLIDMRDSASLRSVRYVLSGGVPLPTQTADAFHRRFGIRVRQQYGSTETGAIAIEPAAERNQGGGSVGLPLAGVELEIVDEYDKAVAIGEVGRVVVRSPFAPSKYDRDTNNSETAFVNGSFRPGDLGRLDASGWLELCGRERGFINVAGNKVDPTEVERVLRELSCVSEAVVLGVPDGAVGEKVKAVLVTSTPCTAVEVMTHCAAYLASFKVPRVIEFRAELPKSPLGKVLRKYLLEDTSGRPPS